MYLQKVKACPLIFLRNLTFIIQSYSTIYDEKKILLKQSSYKPASENKIICLKEGKILVMKAFY